VHNDTHKDTVEDFNAKSISAHPVVDGAHTQTHGTNGNTTEPVVIVAAPDSGPTVNAQLLDSNSTEGEHKNINQQHQANNSEITPETSERVHDTQSSVNAHVPEITSEPQHNTTETESMPKASSASGSNTTSSSNTQPAKIHPQHVGEIKSNNCVNVGCLEC
jgi:hypothetical protein